MPAHGIGISSIIIVTTERVTTGKQTQSIVRSTGIMVHSQMIRERKRKLLRKSIIN